MTEEERLAARFCELAGVAYDRGHATFTDFMGAAELDCFLTAAPAFSHVPYALSGGAAGCERVMARFGDEDSLGYPPPPFPIACLRVRPVAPKFAEPLTHRDCLGALMSLGVRREMLGDIFLGEGEAYVFCTEKTAPYLAENLIRIRHTAVRAEVAEPPAALVAPRTEDMEITLSSPRLDGIVAHACGLSRAEAAALFPARRIFLSGRVCEDTAHHPCAGDILTVRGVGRFRILGEAGVTRKGKVRYRLQKYV